LSVASRILSIRYADEIAHLTALSAANQEVGLSFRRVSISMGFEIRVRRLNM
jgi:hypothetical protein